MRYEVPAIVYAHVLQNVTQNQDNCSTVYSSMGFTTDQSASLCGDASFNDTQNFVTYFNLANIYFYEDVFTPSL